MSVFKKTKGFTIIELMVVIAIIVLLTAIVILAVDNYRGKAKDARIELDFGQLKTIAEAINAESGSYSSFCDGDSFNKAHSIFGPDLAVLEADLKELAGDAFLVRCKSNSTSYCISSYMPGRDCMCCMSHRGILRENGTCRTIRNGSYICRQII